MHMKFTKLGLVPHDSSAKAKINESHCRTRTCSCVGCGKSSHIQCHKPSQWQPTIWGSSNASSYWLYHALVAFCVLGGCRSGWIPWCIFQYPLVISHMACWKITYEWRFSEENELLNNPFSSTTCGWLPEGNLNFFGARAVIHPFPSEQTWFDMLHFSWMRRVNMPKNAPQYKKLPAI